MALLVSALILVMEGCAEDRQKLISEKVEQRVTEFREKKKLECRQRLFRKAETIVDSLLLAEAQEALQDSLGKSRPFRPEQPPAVLPIDSLSVSPLFKDTPAHRGN